MTGAKAEAIEIMSAFAERTGLTSDAEPQRYLWTDAFALVNWLDLYRDTGEERYRELALKLIDQVHHVLGRHHPDDPRTGWLSGLPEEEGARHPTRGGLRIGKPLPERRPDQPFDERLEWERDGQYFHYLTKWMDALARASLLLDEPLYRRQAGELAQAVFGPFLRKSASGAPVGLAWKMSVDLSRPLVQGMNPHDVLDGYATFRFVGAAGGRPPPVDLGAETALLRDLSTGRDWGTADPLGIGGLLLDAFRLAILPDLDSSDEQIVRAILAGADAGVRQFLRSPSLEAPPSRRLAFRELGLAIGLQTVPAIEAAADARGRTIGELEPLLACAGLERRIVESWSGPEIRTDPTWRDHRDINEVMLAAAMLRAQVDTAAVSAGLEIS